MQRFEIHLFADTPQFLLQDDDPAALDVINVDTPRAREVAVTVELHDARPDIDSAQWDKVDADSLSIDSGRLVVASAAEYFAEAFRRTMRRGEYEALVCHGGQRYLVALYPAIEDAAD